jgi:HSP20 family molecular chaperone IbpA
MLFVPEVFRRNGFDEFFDHPFDDRPFDEHRPPYRPPMHPMKTDVKETETGYELLVDLPGVKKEDLKVELNDGCLTITAQTSQNNDVKDEDGKYIRRERFTGTYSRSFYVDKGVTETDIKAKFVDGVLTLDIPKKEPTAPEKKYIAIE